MMSGYYPIIKTLLAFMLMIGLFGSCSRPVEQPTLLPASPSTTPPTTETGVVIDGYDDDWQEYPLLSTDPADDQVAGSPDIAEVKAFNNDRYFYLLIRLYESGITDHYDLIMDINGGEYDYQFSIWPGESKAVFAPYPVTQAMTSFDGLIAAQQGNLIEIKFPLTALQDEPVRTFLIQTFLGDQVGDLMENIITSSVPEVEPEEPIAVSLPETPTPAKIAQPIDSSNIDLLQLVDFTDMGFEYPLVFQRAKFNLSQFVDPGRYIAMPSQNNWGAAQWSADGEFLILETSRGIDILNAKDLTLISEYDGLFPIDILSNGDVVALSNNQVVFLNYTDGTTTVKIELADPGVSLAVSPDGTQLAYASGSQTFNLVDLSSGEMRECEILRDFVPTSISDFSFSPDGTILFVTTPVIYGADVITLFNVETGERLYEIPAAYPVIHAPGTTYYAYWDKSVGLGSGYVAHPSANATKQIVTATFPPYIRARDDTGSMTYDSRSFSFQSDTNTLGVLYLGSANVYGPPNALLYIWDLTTLQAKSIFNLGYPYPFEFAFSPDGSKFFSVDFDGGVHVWDSSNGQQIANTDQYSFFEPASLNPDGSQILLPYYDHFDIVDRATQIVLDSFWYPAFREYTYGSTVPYDSRITFLPDGYISFWVGYQAATPSVMPSMRHTYTYNMQEHQIITGFDYGKVWDSYYQCDFNDDGSIQVCQLTDTSQIQFIDVAEVRTGLSLLRMRTDHIDNYALSRDGSTLAYCDSGAGDISIVNVTDKILSQIHYPCQDMVFLPGDERLLLTDGQIVDLQTKTTVGQFAFQSSYAQFPLIFFRADRNYVLIGTQAFDLQTGALLGNLTINSTVYDIAVTQDDLTLIFLTDRGLEYWQAIQK